MLDADLYPGTSDTARWGAWTFNWVRNGQCQGVRDSMFAVLMGFSIETHRVLISGLSRLWGCECRDRKICTERVRSAHDVRWCMGG